MPEQRRKHVPLRSCIACRAKRPKRELIRIVRKPDGSIEIDPRGKVAGRGAYLCPSRSCWDLALERKRLSQALKVEIHTEATKELEAFAASLPVQEAVAGRNENSEA